jgi:hypothetical protein
MNSAYNFNLYKKATFLGSLEWPLYTGLTHMILHVPTFLGSLEWPLYTGLTLYDITCTYIFRFL